MVRRVRRVRSRWLHTAVVVVAALAVAPPAGARSAATVEIATSNDLSAGNPRADDHYTASFAAVWAKGRTRVTFDEHMFTDRSSGSRFDETWVQVARPFDAPGRWYGTWRAGAVRVGRGVFGERAQNAVHAIVGSDEVDLRYLPGNDLHVAVGAELARRVHRGGRALSFARVDAGSAPGFRHHLEATIDSTVAVGGGVLLSGTVGARASAAEHELLDRHTRTLGAVWQVQATFRGIVTLGWSENRLGIGQRRVHLGFRVPLGGRVAR